MGKEIIISTTDAINRSLDTPALDPVFLSIANDYLAGKTISSIADEYGLPADRITSVIEKKEVKTYIDSVYATQGYLNRVKRINIINQVIEQKMADALETGVFSKKDLLDWMKLLNDMEGQAKPKQTGPAVAIQVNNYEKLMKDLVNG
jgi:hypothetical protein